jgi:hypothetical protein
VLKVNLVLAVKRVLKVVLVLWVLLVQRSVNTFKNKFVFFFKNDEILNRVLLVPVVNEVVKVLLVPLVFAVLTVWLVPLVFLYVKLPLVH